MLVNDLDPARAEAVVAEITAAGNGAEALPFDVTDRDAVRNALGDRQIDILVNNAGNAGAEAMTVVPFAESDPSTWEGPLAVNMAGS